MDRRRKEKDTFGIAAKMALVSQHLGGISRVMPPDSRDNLPTPKCTIFFYNTEFDVFICRPLRDSLRAGLHRVQPQNMRKL